VASRALQDAEEIGLRLKTAVGSVARRAPADGAAVEDTRGHLQELELKLETPLADSLRATGAALHARHFGFAEKMCPSRHKRRLFVSPSKR
jgi:hypothetical protein